MILFVSCVTHVHYCWCRNPSADVKLTCHLWSTSFKPRNYSFESTEPLTLMTTCRSRVSLLSTSLFGGWFPPSHRGTRFQPLIALIFHSAVVKHAQKIGSLIWLKQSAFIWVHYNNGTTINPEQITGKLIFVASILLKASKTLVLLQLHRTLNHEWCIAPTLIPVWSDGALFKLSAHVNRHNSLLYHGEPTQVFGQKINQPELTVWGGNSCTVISLFVFEGALNGEKCLQLLKIEILWISWTKVWF